MAVSWGPPITPTGLSDSRVWALHGRASNSLPVPPHAWNLSLTSSAPLSATNQRKEFISLGPSG